MQDSAKKVAILWIAILLACAIIAVTISEATGASGEIPELIYSSLVGLAFGLWLLVLSIKKLISCSILYRLRVTNCEQSFNKNGRFNGYKLYVETPRGPWAFRTTKSLRVINKYMRGKTVKLHVNPRNQYDFYLNNILIAIITGILFTIIGTLGITGALLAIANT